VTMLAILALLGVGSEAAIPILGYRSFNFWLPIPLAAIFYPTLWLGAGRFSKQMPDDASFQSLAMGRERA
jgi:hypothetical protein